MFREVYVLFLCIYMYMYIQSTSYFQTFSSNILLSTVFSSTHIACSKIGNKQTNNHRTQLYKVFIQLLVSTLWGNISLLTSKFTIQSFFTTFSFRRKLDENWTVRIVLKCHHRNVSFKKILTAELSAYFITKIECIEESLNYKCICK
jgi:hypothetical protein